MQPIPDSSIIEDIEVQRLSPYQRSYAEFFNNMNGNSVLKQIDFVSNSILFRLGRGCYFTTSKNRHFIS